MEEETQKQILNLNRGLSEVLQKLETVIESIGEVAKSVPKKEKVGIDSGIISIAMESESLSMDDLIKKSLDIKSKLNDGLSLRKARSYFG